jgi:glycosyltransferase involved in cell wall biosynthesis
MQSKKGFKIDLLSVVIPAYKQEKTIFKDAKNILKSLDELNYNYELIVVVDGMLDDTYKILKRIKNPNLKIIAYDKNQGKGHAVRTGMLKAKGDIIGFMDAGMDIHPTGFRMLLNHMEWYNADVVVGSKLHPVSKVNYPMYRKVLSWGYRQLTRTLFGFKVRDTQVGIKFFKQKVVRDVLPRLLVKQYAFDIEILAVSYLLGYKKIYEAPVKINFKENSIRKKGMGKVIFLMLWDTAAVYYRLRILNYYKHKNPSKRRALNKFRLDKSY